MYLMKFSTNNKLRINAFMNFKREICSRERECIDVDYVKNNKSVTNNHTCSKLRCMQVD